MMNKLIALLLIITMIACNRKPYVNHKLKLDKVSEDCREQQSYFHITSNVAGERFEFEKCLPADFNNDMITSSRQGDTVLVNFDKTSSNQRPVVYKVALDIATWPTYRFLTIDGDTFMITLPDK